MEERVLDTINEYLEEHYGSLEEALRNHTKRELLDSYLKYEGIIGYTDTILSVMITLGFPVDVEDEDSDFIID